MQIPYVLPFYQLVPLIHQPLHGLVQAAPFAVELLEAGLHGIELGLGELQPRLVLMERLLQLRHGAMLLMRRLAVEQATAAPAG